MFTGIIETTGAITRVTGSGSNKTFHIRSLISKDLKTDQSVSHNGVCLTVEEADHDTHRVTAVMETLLKTNLGELKEGDIINLERCMQMNGRIDGHIVQGHVDDTGTCVSVKDQNGSWEYQFEFDSKFRALVVEKGSICLNGISLTIYNVTKNNFTVAIIPYTYEHTNLQYVTVNSKVNLEFDIIGKYVHRNLITQ